jgi:hypothetical protein
MGAIRLYLLPRLAAARAEEILLMKVTPKQRAARLGNLAWRFVDLSSQRFGKLRVLHRDGHDIAGHVRWHCLCDCGATTIVDSSSLTLRRTRSCGCYMRWRRQWRGNALRIARLNVRGAITLADALAHEIKPEKLTEIFKSARAAARESITRKKEAAEKSVKKL